MKHERSGSILLIEYFTSGCSLNLAPSLVLEGYSMLKALADAVLNDGFKPVVPIDERLIPFVKLPKPQKVKVEPGRLLKVLKGFSVPSSAIIIAPPMGGVHVSLSSSIEELGVEVLGPSKDQLIKVLDKARLARELSLLNIKHPRTFEVDEVDEGAVHKAGERLGYPLIMKPVDGAGCEGLMILNSKSQVKEAVEEVMRHGGRYIAQEVIKGIHASVSLLSDGRRAKALSLNAQRIFWKEFPQKPSYEGGYVPLQHPLAYEALKEAERVVEFLGLRGYVGIDLVLADEGPFIIEINPRLTTSFIALTSATPAPLGRYLIEVSLGLLDPLEVDLRLSWTCIISKLKAPRDLQVTSSLLERLSSIPSVYTTTPLTGMVLEGEAVALLKAVALNLHLAQLYLNDASRLALKVLES